MSTSASVTAAFTATGAVELGLETHVNLATSNAEALLTDLEGALVEAGAI